MKNKVRSFRGFPSISDAILNCLTEASLTVSVFELRSDQSNSRQCPYWVGDVIANVGEADERVFGLLGNIASAVN